MARRRGGLVQRGVTSLIAYYAAQFFYVTALTLAFPIIFFMLLPSDNVNLWVGTQPLLMLISLSLIIISFVILFWRKKKIGKTLKLMGLMTLVPGAVGVLLGILGKKTIFDFFQANIFALETVEPVIDFYLQVAVPKVMILAVSYIFLGILLWLLGDKTERELKGWL